MAITYRIDPRERIVYLTTTGDSSFDEWQAALQGVLADSLYGRGFNFLNDRRGQSNVPGEEFVRKAVLFLVGHTREMGRYRWAAVSSREATFGMLRMFSILADEAGIQVEAFRDYDEARGWLLGASG